MARILVKQPNGKYAIWSSVVDAFIVYDLTKEEYIEFCAKEAYEKEKEDARIYYEKIEKNPQMSFDGCLEAIPLNRSKEETEKIFQDIKEYCYK